MEGDGSRFLNMIHRDDVIGCIIAALKSGRAGEIYNAVDDEPVSQWNFFEWLARIARQISATVRAGKFRRKPQARRDEQARLEPQIENGTRLPVQVSELSHRLQRGNFAAGPRGRTAHRAGRAVKRDITPRCRLVRRCGCGWLPRWRRQKFSRRRFCRFSPP